MRDIDDNYHLAENRAQALQELVQNLTPGDPVEPKGDVTHGVYLGRIESITGTDAPVEMTVDFVTADERPGLTKQQAESSGSWSEYFGWNRHVYPQRFTVDGDGRYFYGRPDYQGGLLVDFVSDWRHSQGRSDYLYDIQVADGRIVDIWPATY